MKRMLMTLVASMALAAASARAADAYIESDGTQFINTGYHSNPQTKIVLDYALVNPTDTSAKDGGTVQARLLGGDEGEAGFVTTAYMTGNAGEGKCSLSLTFGNTFVPAAGTLMGFDTKRRQLTIDVPNRSLRLTEDGTTVFTKTGIAKDCTRTATEPLGLFSNSMNNGTGFSPYTAKMKVYGFQIYESGELIHDYVPALRDGVPGLYDEKTGEFLTNRSVKDGVIPDFTYGGDIRQVEGDPYIESDGTQFINTGYKTKPETRIELDYALTDVADRGYADLGNVQARLFSAEGANEGWVTTLFINGTAGQGNASVYFASGAKWGSYGTGGFFDTRRRTAILDRSNGQMGLLERGVSRWTGSFTPGGSTAAWPLGLFGYPSTEAASNPNCLALMRVYSFKIYESGTLVKDFRPYVKNGRVGLRDIKSANGDFYAAYGRSARPIRSFKCGGPIESDGTDDAYLSSSAAQMINTGYHANPKSRIEVDFAMNNHTNTRERIFGATMSSVTGDLAYGLFCSGETIGAGKFTFGINDGNGEDQFKSYTSTAVDLQRHTAIADLAGGKWYLVTGATTNTVTTVPITTSASFPLCLFSDPSNADGTAARFLADVRIYSVKVYEEDDLKLHYLPYKDATRIGLVDVLTGDVKEDVLSAAVPFTVGGCGWGEDHAAFYDNPKDVTVEVGKSVTLTAYAPAAVSYQWYRDGEPVEGATGSETSVSWVRGVKSAVYTVKAKFIVNGRDVTRESSAATVTMRPLGMLILFR